MIVELFGVPATGKTTYANNTFKYEINALNKYVYSKNRVIRNLKKVNLLLYLFILHNKTFWFAIDLLKDIKFDSFKIKIKMNLYLISYLSVIKIIQNKENAYYLDEGILNVIWAIAYNASLSNKKILNLVLKLKPFLGDTIIYLYANKSIVLKRLLDRNIKGGSELEHDIKKNTKYIDKAYRISEYIYSTIENENNVKLVKINKKGV